MSEHNVTADPIVWADGDEYADPAKYRAAERFWWHAAITAELTRLESIGIPSYNVAGIAGNINGMSASDVLKYIKAMICWGELIPVPMPDGYDHEPDSWVSIAPGEQRRPVPAPRPHTRRF